MASTFLMPSVKRRALLEQAALQYGEALDSPSSTNPGESALSYLQSRGIDYVTATEWRLGYVAEPAPGHERMQGMLAIPYVSPAGVIGMKFRCIQQHDCKAHGHVKYDSEKGVGSYLFGVLNLQTDSPFVCICEGELDTIAATALASLPAVGISGATKWKAHWQYVFEGYDEVVVFLDGDAGKDGKPPASDKFESTILGALSNARSVRLPLGEDVNSFLVAHDAKELWEKAGLDMRANSG